ncbi:MAG: hypothetical protein KF688_17125 [Pirellulales bacterium]|nr:hypothetical protein [Pirellulales bacterium]
MPCYHLSWDAYGQWATPAPETLVVAGQRLLPDRVVAERFRHAGDAPEACFDDALQRQLLAETNIAAGQEGFRVHVAAADATSLHVVVSWNDDRPWEEIRRAVRDSIVRRLRATGQRTWLSHRGTRRRIVDQGDYDRHVAQLLSRPRSWKWSEARGLSR